MSPCNLAGCWYLSHQPGHFCKDFCDSMGLSRSVNFPTQISPNGKSSLLDLVMTNFPANVSSSSSSPIGISDHMLVKVNISLAILREQPQCRRVWQFTQADRQGLQAAISLQNWSPIFTAPDVNSAWEFFHRFLLSLMHRFIPSHLQLSFPYSHPWYSESRGEAVALKQFDCSS